MRQIVSIMALVATLAFASAPRKWTDTSGKFTVIASLVEVKDGKAILKKPDGTIVDVPLEKLSKPDLAFIEDQKAEKTVIADKAEKPSPMPKVSDSEPEPPAEVVAGGTNWKAVKAMNVGDQKWASGQEVWIWPAKDEVLRPGEDGKLHIHFRCQLKPGKKQPEKLVPSYVITATNKSGDVSKPVVIQGYEPSPKAYTLPTDETIEASFDVKTLSGTGTVHFFITSGPAWNFANRPKNLQERKELEKKIVVYSNLIQFNCDLAKP